jgi:two-component system chemotaxis response regulator CheY
MSDQAKHILVVDDSSTMRQLLKMMLKKYAPCRISEAADGQEAFEKIEKEQFDLILTDINMPRMHGLDLVKKVREESSADLPMIIITTKGAEEDRDLGMQLGANAYITKPVNGNKLADTVKSIIP